MLANKLVLNLLLKNRSATSLANYGVRGVHGELKAVGNREWVGYGINGQPNYVDRPDFPFPAIRFKEIKGDLIALREKEKGNWKNLTIEEKKKLYRASFCHTFAEKDAPTGEWKSVTGLSLFVISVGLWAFIIFKLYFLKPLPKTFSQEWREASLRRDLDLKVEHISGLSSKWDYEKDDWKK